MRALASTSALVLTAAACAEPAGQAVSILDFSATAPAGWEAREPQSSMRAAEFDAGGTGAEVVVFYFGPGQGGSAEANVTRWESQFTGPEGEPVEARVWSLEGSAFPTTVAELEGTYSRGVGTGPASGTPEADQALVAAVVETPRGYVFPQLFGPRGAVAVQRQGFLEFVRSIGVGVSGESGASGTPGASGASDASRASATARGGP